MTKTTNNLRTRFVSTLGILTVYLRHTKAGNINVGASLKAPETKAVPTQTSTYRADDVASSELADDFKGDAAQAAAHLANRRFEFLCADALDKGWERKQPRVRKVRVPKRQLLPGIPPVPPVAEAEAVETTVQ